MTVIFYLTGIAAYAQSLSDLAIEEQKRRNSIPVDKVTTIELAPPEMPHEEVAADLAENEDADIETQDPDVETQDADTEENGDEPEYSSIKAALDRETAMYGKPESQWRETMSGARDRLMQLEEEVKKLTSQRNALQLQYNRTNGTRRGPINDALIKTSTELYTNRQNLEQARETLQSLQKEARSSGALPGWIR